MITRDQFLSVTAGQFPRKAVDVPGLGPVHVRVMSAGERDQFEAGSARLVHADFRARLVAATACDDAGTLLFSDADVPALSAVSALTIDPLFKAAVEVNRMAPDADEGVRKNSESGPG